MSRAGKLLSRLEHIGEPVLDEDDVENSDDDAMGAQGGEDQEGEQQMGEPGMPQQQQGSMVPPNDPFSKDLRNPDGSMKTSQNQQPIDDKRGFVRRRM